MNRPAPSWRRRDIYSSRRIEASHQKNLRSALGFEEVNQLLDALLVREGAQVPALAALLDQPFLKQDLQVVRQGGGRHSNLLLDLADDHPIRMRLPQPAQDPEPDLMGQ